MTSDAGNWEPIEADQLRIGHLIKVDHRWFDHPFVRRSFQISSEREIETIREVGLTRMFVDQARSASPGEEAPSAAEPAGEQAPEGEAPADSVKQAPAASIGDTVRIRAQRISLDAASARDRITLERAEALQPVLGSGDADSAKQVDEFVDYLVAILNNSTTPLALMAGSAPKRSHKRLVLQASDAVSLVALVGKRMGLETPQLRMLTQAAATHTVGLTRMPPPLMDEEPAGEQFRGGPFCNYPLLSASILRRCGGFPAEVLRIVREHREKPDGSGFPRGLAGDAIHPLALVLGAVREFQIRCSSDTSPVLALAWLHRHCREIYGAEIIGHLASTMLVYPAGTHVQLSDGRIARVMSINEAARTSPVVSVYEDRSVLREWTTLDLSQNPGISIVRALDTSYLPPRMFERAPRSAIGKQHQEATESAPADEDAALAQASGA